MAQCSPEEQLEIATFFGVSTIHRGSTLSTALSLSPPFLPLPPAAPRGDPSHPAAGELNKAIALAGALELNDKAPKSLTRAQGRSTESE